MSLVAKTSFIQFLSGFLIFDVLGEKAAILGAIAGAQHVRLMAKHYGVPVVLHRWI